MIILSRDLNICTNVITIMIVFDFKVESHTSEDVITIMIVFYYNVES